MTFAVDQLLHDRNYHQPTTKNGIAYAVRRDSLLNQRTVIGDNSYSMVIREKVINIDSTEDLMF